MRVLFCNITRMDYYKGIVPGVDEPHDGGSYVKETKSTKGGRNQLHSENISGCRALGKEETVEDVLVVYCAKHPFHNFASVVIWYQHATVYRNYCIQEFPSDDEGGMNEQWYNAIAKKDDCVLLPRTLRRITEWNVPRRQNGASIWLCAV